MHRMTEAVGYNYSFADGDPPEKYTCSICIFVARNPQQASCCGRVYCKQCLEQLRGKDENFKCPNCKEELANKYFRDRMVEKEIQGLKVYCPNTEKGCLWKGELRNVNTHLRACIKEPSHCMYSSIGCIVMLAKEELVNHMDENREEHLQLAMHRISELRMNSTPGKGPITLKMVNYTQLKETNKTWLSPGFYICPGGYKMCLLIYANGNGAGEGTHISYFLCFMPGEYDDHLEWPFQGLISVEVLNQVGNFGHWKDTAPYTSKELKDDNSRVVDKEYGLGFGEPQFVPIVELAYNSDKQCQYLKDDTLYFRVTAEQIDSATKPWLASANY